jgi:predicted permease
MWHICAAAARILRRSPLFALIVIVTMAIGIGANTALFSLANALYLRPLPVRDPDRLVLVTRGGAASYSNIFSYPLYRDVQEQATSFNGLIAFSPIEVLLGAGDGLTPVSGEIVTGNYFSVLGVRATLGRPLLPDDDKTPDAHPVAVIGDRLWRTHFGASPDIIGRSVLLNHRPYSIVGVAPAEFTGPVLDAGTQIWVPMAMQMHTRPPSGGAARQQGLDLLTRRGNGWLMATARLGDAVTHERANAELAVIANRLEREFPEMYRNFSLRVEPVAEQSRIRGASRTLVGVLFSVVDLVLLVACMNVAGLVIARTSERSHEIGVRLAIGAGRLRLIRDVVGEYVVLAAIGGLAGLLTAQAGTALLRAWVVPPSLDLPLDWRVLAFTVALVAATGLAIAAWPAITAARSDVNDELRGGRTATTSRALARRLLVAVELAVALVLVVGAGLALRTLQNVSRVDAGFSVDRIGVIPLDVRTLGMSNDAALQFYTSAQAAAEGIEGIESAALARVVPLSGGGRSGAVLRPGADPADERSRVGVAMNSITPAYFRTIGVRLLAGREFLASDTAATERVAVVSRSTARELWPEEDAIGREITGVAAQPVRIVGVVEDARYRSPRESPALDVFVPVLQQPEIGMTLFVRTTSASAVRSAVGRLRQLEPRLPLNGVTSLHDLWAARTHDDRVFAWVVSGLAAVALLLATMGIYGVVAFMVNQRRREIGVRMALGATSSSVVAMMLRQYALVVGIGLTVGLALSSGAGRVLRARLFEVPALDVTTYASSVAAILLAATIASWLPARRASDVNPVTVLRAE